MTTRVSAERALALGLVNHVVPEDDCLARAMQIAREIAANDRIAVEQTKEAINRSCETMGMRQALLQGLEIAVVIGARGDTRVARVQRNPRPRWPQGRHRMARRPSRQGDGLVSKGIDAMQSRPET